MTCLFIFDDQIKISALAKKAQKNQQTIFLFPLTSNFIIINQVKNTLQSYYQCSIEMIDTAVLINNAVDDLQKKIHAWSCEIGDFKLGNKSLKEWFLLPDHAGSSWWFGLISEKNTVQYDVFFKIAQVNAFKYFLKKNPYDVYCLSLKNTSIKKIFKKIILNQQKKIQLSIIDSVSTYRFKLSTFIRGYRFSQVLLASIANLLIWFRNHIVVKRKLPALKNRLKEANPFLFCSYFPHIDEQVAKQGIFRNKYALALQDKFKQCGISISWLLMPVNYNGHHFKSATSIAKTFLMKGESLFILQEFFTPKIFFKSMAWWIRQIFLSIYLFQRIDKRVLLGNLTEKETIPLLKYIWWNSFVGPSGLRGIIFYLTFRNFFTRLQSKHCLYYCEMQAWEKALIMAKHQVNPDLQTIAFQHTVVMRNFFNYFYDAKETKRNHNILDLPLPDKLLANGKVAYGLLAKSFYPHLYEAEAIRQLYLTQQTSKSHQEKTKHVLLVVGSYDRQETKSLLSLVNSAFPQANQFEIWFKGSPVNPFEPLFAELKINTQTSGYQIVHHDVNQLLLTTTIALVANTTVVIEALAQGCKIIIPLFSDTMMMNPVIDTSADYSIVTTHEALKTLVEHEIKKPAKVNFQNKNFVYDYWNINSQLPLWMKILKDVIPKDLHEHAT